MQILFYSSINRYPSSRLQHWASVPFLQRSSSEECIYIYIYIYIYICVCVCVCVCKFNCLRRKELKECSLVLCPALLVKKKKLNINDIYVYLILFRVTVLTILLYRRSYITFFVTQRVFDLTTIYSCLSFPKVKVKERKFSQQTSLIFFLLIKEKSMIC